MGTSAAIYTRLSQDRDGRQTATGRQEADCRGMAERLGWEVAQVFEDTDLSAFTRSTRRPAYERMLAAMAAGEIDAVLVYDQDRLVRHPAELERFIDVADAAGTKLAAVTGAYDIATDVGRFIARSLGNVANMESAAKSRRIRRKHLELAQKGAWSGGGKRPFGHTADLTAEEPEEAEAIRDAARRLIAGESLRAITLDWRALGIVSAYGKPFTPQNLRRLLLQARLSGQREHHGEIVAVGTWPAIIDTETGARLRAVLKDPARSRPAGISARSYLLAGFVICGRCEGQIRMVARRTQTGARRYVCKPKETGGCNGVGINAEHLERFVVDALAYRLDSPALAAAMAAEAAEDADTGLMDAIDSDQAALDQLATDHYVDRRIGRSEFFAARGMLERRLEVNGRRLASQRRTGLLNGFVGTSDVLRGEWANMNLDRRRGVIAMLVDRITIAPSTQAGNRFDPDRVDVIWRI